MQKSRSISSRAGRWSATHPKTAIIAWLVFVVSAYMIGGSLGMETIKNEDSGTGESGAAQKAEFDAFPEESGGQVLIESTSVGAEDSSFRAVVAEVTEGLEGTGVVEDVASPYSDSGDGLISTDGSSALVTYAIPGDSEHAEEVFDKPVAVAADVQAAHPEFSVNEFGDASLQDAMLTKENEDMSKATSTSLPFTLIILVFAFGALVAAGVPLLLSLSAIIATMGLVSVASQIAPVSSAVQHVIMLIGLAVGVDYSLFYMRRIREERERGLTNEAALEVAAATSGRAVLISGLTVMIAMAGMYFGGVSNFAAFATGTILVVAVAMIGSLTVLPAILAKLGDKVDRGRIPGISRLKRRVASIGIWSRIIDRVLRRPLVSALISGGVLVALALPAIGIETKLPGIDTFSRDIEQMQTYDRIQEQFPTERLPVTVVVEADDVTSGEVAAGIDELSSQATAQGELFDGPASLEINADETVAVVGLPLTGNGSDASSEKALDVVRDELVPSTLGHIGGVEANVGGFTAGVRDFNDTMISHLPYVFGFVLIAAFALLLVTFRSIVVPLKAIALNLLSVAAAYGVLVAVFQNEWAESLLGFESTGAITAWLPLFLFVILFGLSMDYHVLILSRVRELVDGGMKTEDAVSEGIKSTAGVVTTAAVVMVGVFGVFATLSSIEMKQMGIGLAVAVLLDATIVRAVLLPATMKLLGERNWWLPRSLGWLPRVSIEAPSPREVSAQSA